jgi:hypothetical protein
MNADERITADWDTLLANFGRMKVALDARAATCREESTYANRENHAHRRSGRAT